MTEFEKEIALIKKMGLKTSPLRLEYERKVHELRSMPEKLKAEGYTEDHILVNKRGNKFSSHDWLTFSG